jgi:hypothetical protein
MISAVLDQVPRDSTDGGGAPREGLLDQVAPGFTVHLVERYWWRWEDEPNSDPQYLGQKKLGTTLRIPFPFDVTVRQIRVYMVTVTENGVVNTNDLRYATQAVYPTAPVFTSVVFDNVGNDVDMVFHKNGTGTGNIQVEYKKPLDPNWTTHPTSFAHSATSGSIAITQESTSQTFQVRLKQVGVQNYSRTLEVTILGLSGGNAPPTFTSVAYDTPNSEVDLVFAKNGSGTGNIEVEYKLTSDSTWTTHATTFAHGATSGSILITEAPSAQTFDVRLKQSGVTGYSTTRQVTVDASGGVPVAPVLSGSRGSGGEECLHVFSLSWTAGSGSGTYNVEVKYGIDGSWTLVDWNIAGLSYEYWEWGTGSTQFISFRVMRSDTYLYSNQYNTNVPRCILPYGGDPY